MKSLKNKLTEEEARELIEHIAWNWQTDRYTDKEMFKDIWKDWKEKGYIKESPVERAKNIIYNNELITLHSDLVTYKRSDMVDIKKAIEYLENKIKELEK